MLMGFSIINPSSLGTPIDGNHPINIKKNQRCWSYDKPSTVCEILHLFSYDQFRPQKCRKRPSPSHHHLYRWYHPVTVMGVKNGIVLTTCWWKSKIDVPNHQPYEKMGFGNRHHPMVYGNVYDTYCIIPFHHTITITSHGIFHYQPLLGGSSHLVSGL